MLQNWFILLPEICLILFFPLSYLIELFFKEKTAKTFFMLSQVCLGLSMAFSIVFYNKSAFPDFWQKTPMNTLFSTMSFIIAWAWLYLSSKWFLVKNRSSFKFYTDCMALLLGFDILVSASSIITYLVATIWILFFTHNLILRHWSAEKVRKPSRIYAFYAVLFVLLLLGATAIIYSQVESFSYLNIREFYANKLNVNLLSCIAVLVIISSLFFLTAMVPFHYWFLAVAENCVLPVFGFIALVPALIYVNVLINMMIKCFPQFNNFILPVLTAFAAVSLIVGALSANYEKNLRCLTAFITIFCIGTTIIGLSDFSRTAITASFAYILVAVLSLSGIFTVFLGMKSRSEFLSDLSSVSGFSKLRPYMSATLLVCIFSLIGLSPTVGFLGYLSIYSNFIEQESWRKIALIMIGNLFIAASGLKIIKTIYFEPLNNKYDRTDKAIYICLFIDMALLLISLFKPSWLMRDILIILGGMS